MAFEIVRSVVLSEYELLSSYPERVESLAANALDLAWLELRRFFPTHARVMAVMRRARSRFVPDLPDELGARFSFQNLIARMHCPESPMDIEEAHSGLERMLAESEDALKDEERLTALLLLAFFKEHREDNPTRPYLEEAEILARRVGGTEALVRSAMMGGFQRFCSDPSQRLSRLEAATSLAVGADGEVQGELHDFLSQEYARQDNWSAAAAAAKRSEEAFSRAGHPLAGALAGMRFAEAVSRLGTHAAAMVAARSCLRTIESLGDPEDHQSARRSATEVFAAGSDLNSYLEIVERSYVDTFTNNPRGFLNPNACYLRFAYLDSATETCTRLGDNARAEVYRKRAEEQYARARPAPEGSEEGSEELE